MRLHSFKIGRYKNLRDLAIPLDQTRDVVALVGLNGSGKSNLIEALSQAFSDLEMNDAPSFTYQLEFACRGRHITIDADPNRRPQYKILVDGSATSLATFRAGVDMFLPSTVFAYYSGYSRRLPAIYERSRQKFHKALIRADDLPRRRLFLATPAHSQYALLAFLGEADAASKKFLEERFDIQAFVSATFVLGKPSWKARSGGDDRFWGAAGFAGNFLGKLADASGPVSNGRVVVTGDHGKSKAVDTRQITLEGPEKLEGLVGAAGGRRAFFLLLESLLHSELLLEVKIAVKVAGVDEPIVFTSLSEGEQQLLVVLGLIRFSQESEALYLLDEPDTHLNPRWSQDYVELVRSMMGQEVTSQVVFATHDPIAISNLESADVKVFSRAHDSEVRVLAPVEGPVGLGLEGILRSPMFGLKTTLDKSTQAALVRKAELVGKGELSQQEVAEVKEIDAQFGPLGFQFEFRDPLYARFLKIARAEWSSATQDVDDEEMRKIVRQAIDEADS